MEGLSTSRLPSKKTSSSNNGFVGKAIYDDVFGGPPKFGVPTLSPRTEDYSEIFESFHSSRGSSIPVLDLQVIDGADYSFDVRSSKFDYSEVFGGFNTLDFAVSYEELFSHSNGGGEDEGSSDEDWTPAQSDSLSEGSDPFVCSEKNQSLSNEDPHWSFDSSEQFNISHDKVNLKGKEDILNGMTYANDLQSVPEVTYTVNEAPPLQKAEDENPHLQVPNDLDLSMDLVGAVTQGKRLRKTMSQPPNINFGMQTYGSDDLNPLEGWEKKGSQQKEAFISVSNISLRTQPSQLPPPTRPPPPLAVKKGERDVLHSKFRASKSYAFERMAGESSPPYFDVEIDASSSAAVSAAAMKDAVEKAQAKLRSAKEIMERKKEVQSRTKLRSENDLKYDREESGMKPYPAEEKQKVTKKIEVLSGSVEVEKQINVAGKSRERKHGKEHKSSHGSHITEGSAARTEGSQFFEVVEKEQVNEENDFLQNTKSCESGQQKKCVAEAFGQQKHGRKTIAAREENQEKANVVQRVEQQHRELEKTSNKADKCEELQHLVEDRLIENQVEAKQKLNGANGNIENEKRIKDAHTRNETDRRSKGTFENQDCKRELKEFDGHAKKLQLETKVKQQKVASEKEENEKKIKEVCEREENEKKMDPVQEDNIKELKLDCEMEHNEERQRQALKQEENENNLKEAPEEKEDGSKQRKSSEGEEDDKRLNGSCEVDDNEKRVNDACQADGNENRSKEDPMQEKNEKRSQKACKIEESEMGTEVFFKEECIEKRSKVATEREVTDSMIKDAANGRGLRGENRNYEHTGKEENERQLNPNQESVQMEGQCKLGDDEIPQETREAGKNDKDSEKLGTTQGTLSCEEDGRTEAKGCVKEVVEGLDILLEEKVNSSGMVQNDFHHEKKTIRTKDATKPLDLHDGVAKSNEGGNSIGIAGTYIENDKRASEMASDLENPNILTHKREERGKNIKGVHIAYDQQGRKTGDALSDVLEVKGNSSNATQKGLERLVKNQNETLTPEERDKEERFKRGRELGNERLRKIEEEREREREREKDRMAVDSAILEARERAFGEARERVERAAVDRATAEFRQRALAEAREKLEKATAEARERSLAEKASTEARLRAERAAVERATAEARERAVEKVERSVADKFSASSRSGGMRQSSSSSDLPGGLQFQSVGSSSGSRFLHSSVPVGVESESAQRCKARLERHRRTADRAANALAEKNKRDLLAQREQTERNRLAENLDAEVKRWSSGKEGNLRALLSTLQYILGPDSGWQPVPLTEVITAVAVKKAYRKATLCVHPDKLQQRGATIHQKYICEKVFDLLKEAWNKFNSEER
ncbi:hypothetical protein LguiA_014040 [Lonicera macranthoides]